MTNFVSTISLSGIATREMANDVLALSFSVTKDNKDSNAVQIALREAVQAALEIVRPHIKDGEVDVQTDSFQVHPNYTKSNKVDGYLGSASITVKGTDTATISKIASQITTMVVSGSSNSMSRKARESVETELTKAAIADFRRKADIAAKAFLADSWAVGQVSVRVDGGRPNMGKVFSLAASASLESAPMEIESGKSEMTASVSGSIVLKA